MQRGRRNRSRLDVLAHDVSGAGRIAAEVPKMGVVASQ